jgi:hypothetical protein
MGVGRKCVAGGLGNGQPWLRRAWAAWRVPFLIDWERAGEDGKLVEICASRFQQDFNER